MAKHEDYILDMTRFLGLPLDYVAMLFISLGLYKKSILLV